MEGIPSAKNSYSKSLIVLFFRMLIVIYMRKATDIVALNFLPRISRLHKQK